MVCSFRPVAAPTDVCGLVRHDVSVVVARASLVRALRATSLRLASLLAASCPCELEKQRKTRGVRKESQRVSGSVGR